MNMPLCARMICGLVTDDAACILRPANNKMKPPHQSTNEVLSMNIRKLLCVLFAVAACCFLAGTINHIVNTHEDWLSSLLLAGGCLCGAIALHRKK